MIKKYDEFVQDINESGLRINCNIDGLNLIKKISKDDFMNQLKDDRVSTDYIYRLVNYEPSPKKWVLYNGVYVPYSSGSIKDTMFKSPFVICPNSFRITDGVFSKTLDGKYTLLKNKKIIELTDDTIKSQRVIFSALSISALINKFEEENIEIDLDDILRPDNEEILGRSLKEFGRNYIGYNFDSVLVYEVIDSETAVESIIEENNKTYV